MTEIQLWDVAERESSPCAGCSRLMYPTPEGAPPFRAPVHWRLRLCRACHEAAERRGLLKNYPKWTPPEPADELIVDEIAVERRLRGDTSVRLRRREVVEAVRLGSAKGMSEKVIGEALGVSGDVVRGIRRDHRIPFRAAA